MADYEQSITVDAEPEALFAYLSEVRNLPKYFDRMTSAEPADGEAVKVTAKINGEGDEPREVEGEAWFRVDEAARTLAWGSEGPNSYQGELDVADGGAACVVTVRLHTTRAEGDSIEEGLRTTLGNIKRLSEE